MEIENLSSAYAVLTANGIKTDEATTYIKAALNELGDSGSTVGKILKGNTGKGFFRTDAGRGSPWGVRRFASRDSVRGMPLNSITCGAVRGWRQYTFHLQQRRREIQLRAGADAGEHGATGGGFWQDDGHHGVRQKRLANATENMKSAIGDKLTPALKKVYEAAQGAFEWATKFVEEHPDVVAAVTGLTAALAALGSLYCGDNDGWDSC